MTQILKNGKTRSEQNTIINNYIIDCIIDSDRLKKEYDLVLLTERERINYVVSEFERCCNHPHNLQKFPNICDRFGDWLKGLPGVFQIDYDNDTIIKIAVSWGALAEKHTVSQASKITENWWRYIANKFFQVHRKLNK